MAENPIRKWLLDGWPQPSLRDGSPWVVEPSVETLAYSHRSLQDEQPSESGDAVALLRPDAARAGNRDLLRAQRHCDAGSAPSGPTDPDVRRRFRQSQHLDCTVL